MPELTPLERGIFNDMVEALRRANLQLETAKDRIAELERQVAAIRALCS